jgi:drug/metabolite transporter (DMT)-like permease
MPSTQNVLCAVAWMMGALLSFSLVAVSGREALKQVHTTELMFWRAVIGVLILLGIALMLRRPLRSFASQQPKLQSVRACVHFGAQYAWLFALTLLPLVELFALEFTAPLWVAVLSPLLLGERLSPLRAAMAVVGFAGALIVIAPAQGEWLRHFNLGSALGLASAVGFACNMMAVRKLTRTDPPMTLLVWMNGLQVLIAAAIVFFGTGLQTVDGLGAGWIVLCGVAGLSAHYCLTQAFRNADAIIVAPMDFLRLPLIAFVGVWVYSEALRPAVLAGALCIVIANAVNIWAEHRSRQR